MALGRETAATTSKTKKTGPNTPTWLPRNSTISMKFKPGPVPFGVIQRMLSAVCLIVVRSLEAFQMRLGDMTAKNVRPRSSTHRGLGRKSGRKRAAVAAPRKK